MRIGIVIGQRAVMSGGAIQAVQLAGELQQRDHSVCLVFSKPDHPLAAAAQEAVAERFPLLAVEMNSIPAPGTLWRVRKWLRRHQVEVVYAVKGKGLSTALMATCCSSIPVIGQRGMNYPLDFSSRLKYRHPRVKAIVAVSQKTAEVLAQSDPALRRKTRVVYQAYREQFLQPEDPDRLRRELEQTADMPLVGVVGNLLPRKGHIHLLRILPRLLEQFPELKLVFIGSGHLESVLPEDFAHRESVLHLGFRNDVPQLLPGLTVSVNPAVEGEGLTGTTRESMVAGVPVVVTDVAGTGELIRDGETGFLVSPGDEVALGARILDLLKDKQLRQRMAAAGQDEIREMCSPDRRVEQMLELFRAALAEK